MYYIQLHNNPILVNTIRPYLMLLDFVGYYRDEDGIFCPSNRQTHSDVFKICNLPAGQLGLLLVAKNSPILDPASCTLHARYIIHTTHTHTHRHTHTHTHTQTHTARPLVHVN